MEKICSKCNLLKAESEFYFRDGNPINQCKSCCKEYANSRKEANRENQRKFRENNPNYQKEYQSRNRGKYKGRYKGRYKGKYSCKTYYAKNKEKYLQRNKEYRKNLTRDQKLRYKYSITEKELQALIESQGNKCKICDTPFSENFSDRMNIDHDHTTGKLRGLLCHKCNTGLGLFKDDISRLHSAIDYLSH